MGLKQLKKQIQLFPFIFLLIQGLLFVALFKSPQMSFFQENRFLQVKTDSLLELQSVENWLIHQKIEYVSETQNFLFWDFDRWKSVPLNQIEDSFLSFDPRLKDHFQSIRSFFQENDEKRVLFQAPDYNEYLLRIQFYRQFKRLLKIDDSWQHSLTLIISLFSVFLMMLNSGLNSKKRLGFIPIWLLFWIFQPSLTWIIPSTALLYLTIPCNKRKVPHLFQLCLSFFFFMLFTYFWDWKVAFFIMNILFFSYILDDEKTGERDHTLFEPILLLQNSSSIISTENRSSIKKSFILLIACLNVLLFIWSFYTLLIYDQGVQKKWDHEIQNVQSLTSEHLKYQLAIPFTPLNQDALFENGNITITRFKDIQNWDIQRDTLSYDLETIPSDSLEYRILYDLKVQNPISLYSFIVIFIYFIISWLTTVVPLWQSSTASLNQDNFVFKIRRRLKVA